MLYPVLCIATFLSAYTLNMLYTSVFYHRALTHRALRLPKRVHKFVVVTGNWVTGIDPLTWICMHRLHHAFSDTPKDPHSPLHRGFFRLILVQLKSYGETMDGLLLKKRFYTSRVRDLHFSVNWLNRSGLWFIPHLMQTLLAVAVAWTFGAWELALCLWLGLMSHPLQGWLVNAFGHRYGYRNFRTKDHSTNNWWVSWLVMGEGLQNNHHHRPRSPHFAEKWWEVDFGYVLCLVARFFGLVEFQKPLPKAAPNLQLNRTR